MIQVAMWAAPVGQAHSPLSAAWLLSQDCPGGMPPGTSWALSLFHSTPSPVHLLPRLAFSHNFKPLSGQVLWHQRSHTLFSPLSVGIESAPASAHGDPETRRSDRMPEKCLRALCFQTSLRTLKLLCPFISPFPWRGFAIIWQ